MDTPIDCTVYVFEQEPPVSPRFVVAEAVSQFDRLDSPRTSCSRIARQLEVPDSTLRYWLRKRWNRMTHSRWPPQVVHFVDSPDGLAFLHVLLTAAHLVFVQTSDCGIRNLCWFLELSGLDEFIAPSYGAQQAVAQQMELNSTNRSAMRTPGAAVCTKSLPGCRLRYVKSSAIRPKP